jgi:hypothetical protein
LRELTPLANQLISNITGIAQLYYHLSRIRASLSRPTPSRGSRDGGLACYRPCAGHVTLTNRTHRAARFTGRLGPHAGEEKGSELFLPPKIVLTLFLTLGQALLRKCRHSKSN